MAAILGCAAALAGGSAAVAPGAGAAPPKARSCGAKVIVAKAKGGKSTKTPVSRIRVEGDATCRQAYAVIRGVLTKRLPRGWTVTRGNFKVPSGLVAQVAVNGHRKVMFALPAAGG